MFSRRAILVVVAVVLAACSGSGGSNAKSSAVEPSSSTTRQTTTRTVPKTTPPTTVKPVVGWTRAELTPVSQPVVAGGRIVLYVSAKGALQIVGLDPRGGQTVWTDTASPGSITRGVAPELPVVAGKVVYLKSAEIGSELSAADPVTGKSVWTSPPGDFSSWPEQCPGDPADVCSTGTVQGSPATILLRFNGATGALLPSPPASGDQSSRELAPGLYDPGTRSPEKLEGASGTSSTWSQTLAAAFAMAGLSTDNGWNFDRVRRVGLFVGSVTGAPASQSSTQVVFDLSKTTTSALRIADGSVVWTDPRTQYMCSILPCPGADTTTSSGSGAGSSQGPTLGVRVRSTGTVTGTSSSPTPVASPGLKVILEGFDLATGHTRWTFDTGPDADLATETVPPRTGNTVVVLPATDHRLTLVDLSTGAHRVAAGSTVAWCHSEVTYHETAGGQSGNDPGSDEYIGQDAIFPCNLATHQIATPKRVPAFVGTPISGLVVWSEANRVVAAPQG